MIPRQQTYQHDPDNGIYGDCARTCLAALLNKTQDEVPHFLWDNCDNVTFNRRIDIFLRSVGLTRRVWTLPSTVDFGGVMNYIISMFPGQYVSLCGMSRSGVNHQVLVMDSDIVLDPSANGIVGPADDGNWYIETYIPLLVTNEVNTIEDL